MLELFLFNVIVLWNHDGDECKKVVDGGTIKTQQILHLYCNYAQWL
jgi:hypothetical protein